MPTRTTRMLDSSTEGEKEPNGSSNPVNVDEDEEEFDSSDDDNANFPRRRGDTVQHRRAGTTQSTHINVGGSGSHNDQGQHQR